MKKLDVVIKNIYKLSVTSIFLIIITMLCFYNATSTSYLINWEHTAYVKDSAVMNIIFTLCAVLVAFYIGKSKSYHAMSMRVSQDKEFRKWKRIIIGCTFILSAIWAISTQFVPGIDEYAIQAAVREVMQGDFSSFQHMAYMDQYPNQWGFFLFSYVIACFFGKMNFLVIELLIALAIAVVFKELSELSALLGAKNSEQLIVLLMGIIYFPFLLYSTMVYGNIFGIAFALAAIKHEMLFFKTNRKRNALQCSIFIALGILMKSNMQIYFLAILFAALVNIVRNPKKVISLVVLVCLAYYTQEITVKMIIKLLTKSQLSAPITPFAWIAMGLQDGDLAPGWWNSYSVNSYYSSAGDISVHALVCKESIKNSIIGFINSPSTAIDFFTKKILSTWTNPTFQCFGTVREGSYVITPYWVNRLLSYSGQYLVTKYLNILCFMIYIGSLLFVLISPNDDTDNLILPMTFIGGFIFYLFWETKSRYALMFFCVLIPCAIRGFSKTINYLKVISIRDLKQKAVTGGVLKKIQYVCVLITALGFIGIYSIKFNYLLNQDTDLYHEYVANSSKVEITMYIERE